MNNIGYYELVSTVDVFLFVYCCLIKYEIYNITI